VGRLLDAQIGGREVDVSARAREFSGATLVRTSIVDNFGPGIYNGGLLTVLDSTISRNRAVVIPGGPAGYSGSGGGIFNFGQLKLSGSTIADNTAVFDGGGIANRAPFRSPTRRSRVTREWLRRRDHNYDKDHAATVSLNSVTVAKKHRRRRQQRRKRRRSAAERRGQVRGR